MGRQKDPPTPTPKEGAMSLILGRGVTKKPLFAGIGGFFVEGSSIVWSAGYSLAVLTSCRPHRAPAKAAAMIWALRRFSFLMAARRVAKLSPRLSRLR